MVSLVLQTSCCTQKISIKNTCYTCKLMLRGLKMTFLVTLVSLLGTQIVGFLLAVMRLSRYRLLTGVAAVYLEIFRNIPLFVLIFVVYYTLPILLGLSLSAFQALVLAIVLNESAYVCEIFRGGIESISPGHIEAAHSLGLSRWQTMRRIVMPQAVRRMLCGDRVFVERRKLAVGTETQDEKLSPLAGRGRCEEPPGGIREADHTATQRDLRLGAIRQLNGHFVGQLAARTAAANHR